MTPEIKQLDAEIRALQEKRYALMQTYLASKAIAQVGDLITWGQQGRKGRVTHIIDRYSDPGYLVINIRKDGTDGAKARVSQWDKPGRVES